MPPRNDEVGHERYNPEALTPPTAYSHAVRAGDLLFLSGQLSLDGQRRLVGPDDLAAQTRRTFENVGVLLETAGFGWRDVVKLTVYLTDVGSIQVMRDVRSDFFAEAKVDPPAITTLEVSGLAVAGALIEVDAIAVRQER